MKNLVRACLVFTAFAGLLCADSPEVAPVVVTGTRSAVSAREFDRQVSLIDRADIESAPFASLSGLLSPAGVDVQSRGPGGIQSDLGMRGGSFQQTLVMIDGVRCNDPQTGHHNMDIPVPLDAVERIEVLSGPASSSHGADALGGTVNLVTRSPKETFVTGRIGGGSFGTASSALSAGGTIDGLGQVFAVEGARTDGFMADRDSRSFSASSRSSLVSGAGTTRILAGYGRKDFGAFDFYTPGLGFASREWTRSYISSASQEIPAGGATITLSGSFHRHDDRFLLDRDSEQIPASSHQTRIWTGSAQVSGKPVEWLTMSLGGETAGDGMESSTLGSHWRPRQAGFGEANAEVFPGLNLLAGVRHDRTAGTGSWSPSGGASWWATGFSRLRFHAGKSFRIPTFTEMYYSDAKHINTGNPGLEPEEAVSYEEGIDLIMPDESTVSLTAFDRMQYGTIDWIGPTPKGPWRTINSFSMRFYGTEVSAKTRIGIAGVSGGLNKTWSRYSLDEFSKYALSYPSTSARAGIEIPVPPGVDLTVGFLYKKIHSAGEISLLDCRISRKMGELTLYAEGTNLLDRKYEEPFGVSQQGIWLGGGISYSWKPRLAASKNE